MASRVFISYARKDGTELAQRLQADLSVQGFSAWLDTQRLIGGVTWTPEIEAALDSADYALALLTKGSYVSELCRAEQLRALRKGTCVIPLKAQADTDIPLHLEAKNYRDFSDATRYEANFGILLNDMHGNVSSTLPEHYRTTAIRYLTAPPCVANYLDRPEALRALRDTLFSEGNRQSIALTALSGMGGIGKTVLAKALTKDKAVQDAFPDGIVWITAGKERKRDFIEEMREVAKALGDDPGVYDTSLACQNRYRTAIARKAALIVVDDVWSKADIEPLLADSPRSRFLFTTRDASIGRFVAAREHRTELLDPEQARELLASWANLAVNQLPAPATGIVSECGRLPLSLSIIGAMLCGTDESFWAATLNLLRKADISGIEDQLPEGQQSFFRAVEVSFRSLKPEMQERYKKLAVLLEDVPAPLAILQTLWNVDKDQAARIAKIFIDRSLAQRDDISQCIGLHDLQLDYIRAQFPDRQALELIHGAVRLSAHVLTKDPGQFASQMMGRLLPHCDLALIKEFTESVARGTSEMWFRPLHANLHPPGTSLIRTLHGHTYDVKGVALSGDGRLAISASGDHTLKVWDVESGRELRTLVGHSYDVNSVALSGDGRYAVSASQDQTLKVWDTKTGRELRTMQGHRGSVLSAALSGNGSRAVSASVDQTLKVWDVELGRELRTLTGHAHSVHCVALSGDGKRAVSASQDRTLKVWDVESGRELRTLSGHAEAVLCVALSEDGERAVSASQDQTLKVWDVETGRELRNLRGHANLVYGVALSGDGRRAVSASWDDSLKVWDVQAGRELRTMQGHAHWVNAVALSRDGRRAVSASSDHTLKVWDVETGHRPLIRRGHKDPVRGVAMSTDGRNAISASEDYTLKVWDVETGRELRTLEGHTNSVNAVALSGDGRRAVSASEDKTLKVWDVLTGRELRTLRGHNGEVNAVALSGDGRQAISASEDRRLKLWDVEIGRELRTLKGHTDWVRRVELSEDGRRAVSTSGDETLKVWDLKRGHQLGTLKGHTDAISDISLSRDGRRAISVSDDGTLRVWDLESGSQVQTLQWHKDRVQGVLLTGDMQRTVLVEFDNTLRLWDPETDKVTAGFTCDAEVCCCAFLNDRLVAGDVGGHVHFLRLEKPKSRE